jgi:glycosyltransferase involved in cell wall biosynthesis
MGKYRNENRMKLLIITQKVNKNDPILGFFHKWIEEFSKHYEKVSVICLEKGEFNLPANVNVYSLGKEKAESKIKYILRFYKYILSLRKEYDVVFVHMNQIYVLLGGLFWRIWDKKIGLWYVHKEKTLSLWLATFLINKIFTSSPESFKIKSKKVYYVGHGIDMERFKKWQQAEDINTISYIGRITEIKNIKTLIKSVSILNKENQNKYRLRIIGNTITDNDKNYKNELEKQIEKLRLTYQVEFIPSVSQDKLPELYKDTDITVNLTLTGGMDKTVLESLASNRAVFASNQAFIKIFGEYSQNFLFEDNSAENLALKIRSFEKAENYKEMISNLSEKVRKDFDITSLINKLARLLNA